MCGEEFCNFSSNNKQVLKTHTDSVHQRISRFVCNVCEYKSYHHHCVVLHQKKCHKDEKVNVQKLGCKDCERNIFHKKHNYKKKSDLGNSVKIEDSEEQTENWFAVDEWLMNHVNTENRTAVKDLKVENCDPDANHWWKYVWNQ